MRTQTTISLLAATALLLASVSAVAQGNGQGRGRGAMAQDRAQVERGQKDFDRDRMRDRDRTTSPAKDRDRDRDQDRTHAPDRAKFGEERIQGGELMSVEERNQYREQLRMTESDPEARAKFMAQHKEKMRTRANQEGDKIKDRPEPEEAK